MRDDVNQHSNLTDLTEVKDMAVRSILTRAVSRTHIARDLGIGLPTLTRWVRDAIESSPYGDVLESLHDEVGDLRRENAALRKMLVGRTARMAATTIRPDVAA